MSADKGGATRAVVIVTERRGRESVETETTVTTLAELYAACLRVPPGSVVRVHVFGPEGEVRLNFASFTQPAK